MVNITFSGTNAAELFGSMEQFLSAIQSMNSSAPGPIKQETKVIEPVKTEVKPIKVAKAKPETTYSPAEDVITPDEGPKVPASPKKKITKDQVREGLQGVMSLYGIAKVQEILGQFKVDSVSKLDESLYEEVLTAIKSIK